MTSHLYILIKSHDGHMTSIIVHHSLVLVVVALPDPPPKQVVHHCHFVILCTVSRICPNVIWWPK